MLWRSRQCMDLALCDAFWIGHGRNTPSMDGIAMACGGMGLARSMSGKCIVVVSM